MISQELRITLTTGIRLEATGEHSDSVFLKTEDRILSNTDYQEALQFVADGRTMRSYRSMTDFLFCESFPSWKPHCSRYYKGNGPRLIDHPAMTDEMIAYYDEQLCLILHGCLYLFTRKRRLAWEHVAEAAIQTLAEAA